MATPVQKVSGAAPLQCPHCKREQEAKVWEFVVPGRVGPTSATQDECEHCNAPFRVECIAPAEYEVRPC